MLCIDNIDCSCRTPGNARHAALKLVYCKQLSWCCVHRLAICFCHRFICSCFYFSLSNSFPASAKVTVISKRFGCPAPQKYSPAQFMFFICCECWSTHNSLGELSKFSRVILKNQWTVPRTTNSYGKSVIWSNHFLSRGRGIADGIESQKAKATKQAAQKAEAQAPKENTRKMTSGVWSRKNMASKQLCRIEKNEKK